MRFVWAVVAFFLAVVCVGSGIAQRTVFLGPNTHQEQLAVDADQQYTLVDVDVLSYLPGSQTLMAKGEGDLFAAYGRTSDMLAWLSDTSFNHVTVSEIKDTEGEKQIDSAVVEATFVAEPTAEEGTDVAVDPAEAAPANRNPAGSDLWIAEFTDQDTLIQSLNLPAGMSVLIAADGTQAAPSDISVKWSIDNSTPWAGPLVVLGGIFAAIGIVLYILGIRDMRRKRGPRRRGLPPLPVTQPLSLAELEEAKGNGMISSSEKKDSNRRPFLAIPLVLATAVALSGCTAEAWPQGGDQTPSSSPSPTVIAQEGQKSPVLLESQATRILVNIAETAAAADASLDVNAASVRLTGPVLEARETNYKLRAAIADFATPTAVPDNWTILLPQAADTWPRSFLAIHKDDSDTTIPPIIMMVTQLDQWSEYKLEYAAEMEASSVVPGLAPADIGATLVNPDNAFLTIAPEDLAAMYVDIIDKGDQSEFAPLYDFAGDQFREQMLTKRQESLDAFNLTATGTGEMTFATEVGTEPPVALATLDSGAIVAVTIKDIESPKSINEDAVIRVGDNQIVTTLTGVTEAATGFKTTYQSQLFFFVPAQGSTEHIRLLGYSSSILNSEVLP